MNKKLIINADDFGICREANDAIKNLITAGRLRNVSVLANSWFFDDAAEFLLNCPEVSVGVHLNVVEGIALSPAAKAGVLLGDHGEFLNLTQLLLRWTRAPFAVAQAVEVEWRTQIEFLLKSGLEISHADSHQHIHAFPPFWNILVKLCREYGIPAARLPREANALKLRRRAAFALGQSATVSKFFVSNRNLQFNNHFLGFKRAGSYGEEEMIYDLKNLQEGVTELCVHPSVCDGVPYAALRGELEYNALSGSKLWKQISESKIELVSWTDFSKAPTPEIN